MSKNIDSFNFGYWHIEEKLKVSILFLRFLNVRPTIPTKTRHGGFALSWHCLDWSRKFKKYDLKVSKSRFWQFQKHKFLFFWHGPDQESWSQKFQNPNLNKTINSKFLTWSQSRVSISTVLNTRSQQLIISWQFQNPVF
jgi:hypothetical protein